ncbi:MULTISPECIES: prepilin-type N-terminal cleavage/methylation domain-containing protein [Aeromonas]|nr:prepilin-type N-terminal cleavage/methylation domain-containing protein [Aeromonas sp. FDAARGOS 1409]
MKVASSARRQSGFTLLEVLLVAMLMGRLEATAMQLGLAP